MSFGIRPLTSAPLAIAADDTDNFSSLVSVIHHAIKLSLPPWESNKGADDSKAKCAFLRPQHPSHNRQACLEDLSRLLPECDVGMWAGFVFVNAAHEDRPFALIIVQPSGCPARPAGALRGCLAETLRGLERFEESDEEPSDEETTALDRFEESDEETTALE
jgi:hypothetical protein